MENTLQSVGGNTQPAYRTKTTANEREVQEMGETYLVTNMGEYMDVIGSGEILSTATTLADEGVIRQILYRYDGGIYAIAKLDDRRIYCARLA